MPEAGGVRELSDQGSESAVTSRQGESWHGPTLIDFRLHRVCTLESLPNMPFPNRAGLSNTKKTSETQGWTGLHFPISPGSDSLQAIVFHGWHHRLIGLRRLQTIGNPTRQPAGCRPKTFKRVGGRQAKSKEGSYSRLLDYYSNNAIPGRCL